MHDTVHTESGYGTGFPENSNSDPNPLNVAGLLIRAHLCCTSRHTLNFLQTLEIFPQLCGMVKKNSSASVSFVIKRVCYLKRRNNNVLYRWEDYATKVIVKMTRYLNYTSDVPTANHSLIIIFLTKDEHSSGIARVGRQRWSSSKEVKTIF